jgi:hypothetical protein
LQEPRTQYQSVAERLAVTTVNLLLQAAIQYSAQSQPVVEAVAAFGIAEAKQVQADQVAALDHQVQTEIDIVYLADTVQVDKDFQEALAADLIAKATINTPAVVAAAQVVQVKMPAITDTNILHQTAALA